MRIKDLIVLTFITTILVGCKQSFDKKDLSIINTYNVGDTLIFKSNTGLFDSIEIIDKQFQYNGLSEGYSGNPETGFISYRTIPPGKPELVGFGGPQGDVYSNEKFLLTAVKRDKHKPATVEIKYCGFGCELPSEQKLVRDNTYGTYYDLTHFCINCIGVDSTDAIRLKWKPSVGIIWYQKKDSSTYTLVSKSNAKKRLLTGGLAIWRGDEYILNFLLAIRLQFQPTSNAEQ